MDSLFDGIAYLLSFFYELFPDYGVAIALLTCTVMLATTPLTLKSTYTIVELQRLQPQIRAIQVRYKDDRPKLNEEMMRFYKEHNINPLGGCLPMLIQLPLFSIIFYVVGGLVREAPFVGVQQALIDRDASLPNGVISGFQPKNLNRSSELYQSLLGRHDMPSLGLDLSISPAWALGDRNLVAALPYLMIVALIGLASWFQQNQIQARNSVYSKNEPTGYQRLATRSIPVSFAGFGFICPTALCLYFLVSMIWRAAQQTYITHDLRRRAEIPPIRTLQVSLPYPHDSTSADAALTVPEHGDLHNLRLWIDRITSDFERKILAENDRRTHRERRRRGKLVEQLQLTCQGQPPESGMECIRLLAAAGVVRYGQQITGPPQASQVPESLMLDLITDALWPIVVAQNLPDGWYVHLANLTSSNLARCVRDARMATARGQVASRRAFQARLAEDRIAPGIMRLLRDLNDPKAGASYLIAVADAASTDTPPPKGSPRKLLGWILVAAASGNVGNRADALVVDSWHWLEDTLLANQEAVDQKKPGVRPRPPRSDLGTQADWDEGTQMTNRPLHGSMQPQHQAHTLTSNTSSFDVKPTESHLDDHIQVLASGPSVPRTGDGGFLEFMMYLLGRGKW